MSNMKLLIQLLFLEIANTYNLQFSIELLPVDTMCKSDNVRCVITNNLKL